MKDSITSIASGLTVPPIFAAYGESPGVHGNGMDVMQRIFRDTVRLDESITEAVAAIMSNPDWTGGGKVKAKGKEAPKFSHQSRLLRVETEGLIKTETDIARRNQAKKEPVDPYVKELRAQEIRRLISERVGTDGLAMKTIINDAITTANPETLDALLHAPGAWEPQNLIDDFDALKIARFEMQDAELGGEVAALIKAGREMASRFDAVDAHISELVSDDDNITGLAFGSTNDASDDSDDDLDRAGAKARTDARKAGTR
jgi:hypothetical protein